jgi:L-arabinose transport system substrate-binding protein
MALVLTIVMAAVIFIGCRKRDEQIGGQKKLTFEYITVAMTMEWFQQVEEALKEEGKLYNFEVLTADANNNIETQLSQIDGAIVQNIDGAFLFVVDEGQASAAVAKFNAAGIPVIGESAKLEDGAGNALAPYVELDAEGVGSKCGQWVVDNWKSTGVDISNLATVGVIGITNSRIRTDTTRTQSFIDALKKDFPNLPDSNIYWADTLASNDGNDPVDAAYRQVSAIIGTHSEKTAWIIFGAMDNYGQGAVRAVEQAGAGVEEQTILVSSGGEVAVREWANNAAPAWRATCYYNARDFAKPMVEGMLAICRDGKKATDIYPEFKQPGQQYGVVKISGDMCTSATYKNFLK